MGVPLCVIVGCAALTLWYVSPWRQAGRLAEEAVSAGVAATNELGSPGKPSTLFVRGLPEAYCGAPVFANCYPQAIGLATGGSVAVRVVAAASRGAIHPDVMELWKLQPGEYLVAFDAEHHRMRVIRHGNRLTDRTPGVAPR